MPTTWRYRKLGTCDYCQDESATLSSPEIPGLRVVVPPLFCRRCQMRFEQLRFSHATNEDPNTVLRAMRREPSR